jgi:hypothetical protein
LNAGRKLRLAEEMRVMQELPERRMESCKRERVRVDSDSLIYVDRNVYSVPSRLIGEQVEARLYMEHIEVWYGQKKVEQLQRLRGRQKHRVPGIAAVTHVVDHEDPDLGKGEEGFARPFLDQMRRSHDDAGKRPTL